MLCVERLKTDQSKPDVYQLLQGTVVPVDSLKKMQYS